MNSAGLAPIYNANKRGNEWVAKCPSHEDSTASLNFHDEGDKVLMLCRAECPIEGVLGAKGLKLSDLYHESNGLKSSGLGVVSATYDYQGADAVTRHQTIRYTPKAFRQRQPDGNRGWIWNLKGVDLVLYRLPELRAADPEEPVFVVEGEKDVEALREQGLVATCNPMGAGKWRDEFSEHLRGRWCVILPDNDETGRAHAEQVARSLQDKARKITVLQLPGLPDKGDVSDWLWNGGTAVELQQLATLAPEPEAASPEGEAVLLSESLLDWETNPPPSIRWVLEGVVPEASLCLLFGRPFGGKSLGSLQLALHLAAGVPFLVKPDGSGFTCPAPFAVLYIDEEMGRPLMDARTRKMMAGREEFQATDTRRRFRVISRKGLRIDQEKSLDLLRREIDRFPGGPPALVIYDTMRRLHGGKEDKSDEMAPILETLVRLQEETEAAGLALHHSKKNPGEDDDWRDAARGSGDFVAASQSIISLWKTADLLFSIRGDAKAHGEFEPIPLILDPVSLLYRVQSEEERFATKDAQKEAAILEAVASLCKALSRLKDRGGESFYPPSWTTWREKASGNAGTLAAARKRLEDNGKVRKAKRTGKGGGDVYMFAEDYEATMGTGTGTRSEGDVN